MTDVIVVIGSGSIGQAIARRVGAGKHVILADLREEAANAAAKRLSNAGMTIAISHDKERCARPLLTLALAPTT